MIPNLMKLGISVDLPPTVYSILNSYVNFDKEEQVKIANLAKAGRSVFFDFEYPLTDNITKSDFETIILNHFMMRRIGYETVTAFKLALNVKLNEIMPMYNKLFDSIKDWNIFRDGETISRTKEEDSTINTISNSTTNTTSENISDRRYSNTPQNQIQDIKDGRYVSEYNYDTDNSTADGTTNGNSNSTDNTNTVETINKTPGDKMKLYSEFLQKRQNIYTMIFRDLDSLFYQLI